ncbi:MAG TPA: Smr/MutS family protein [Acidobacteriaceae bacterium]|jgi:DNA mismatch repair protein MutS2|nr:Smr/MutS family protein [Acidobacteriaceae bacterium]
MPLLPDIPDPVPPGPPLEWDKFVAFLGAYTQSALGRAWIASLIPSQDRAWIARQHALVAEMRLLSSAGAIPITRSLFDPSDLLARARIDGVALESPEILALIGLADEITAWTNLIDAPPASADPSRIPQLTALTQPLLATSLRPLTDALHDKILPDGTLADDASSDLRRIRREMERQQRSIEESLRSALRRYSDGGSTQEDLITIRGERFVIPVKTEWKRRVQGVVHGASSSGQTVYVEPLETIELNNDLVRLLEEEQAEIHRFFLHMTRQIAQVADPILKGAAVLAEVDTLLARARFAQEYACVAPQFAPESTLEFRLKNARHPLLERRLRADAKPIVPVSLDLSNDHRQLIISGPNTGGKTVSLKTAGLLAIMAQAGVPVPADEAVSPVFDAFLADIGDAQSIEEDLSTFSAHVNNLNRIAARATPRSLVLLDELGSATDPEEGAALAVAVAEHFLHAGAWSIVSTHLTALKVYAENSAGAVNAAVGFNEETLAPTYELRQGVPGASAGINIAQRLGLNPQIVHSARQRLTTQTQDIARFLASLHEQLTALDQERLRTRRLEQELSQERARLSLEGMKEWRAKVRDLETQMQSLLRDFEYQARENVRAIEDRAAQQKLSKEAERRIARLRREFSETFNTAVVAQHTGADRGDRHAQPHVARHVAEGDMVKLRSLGKIGTVRRQIDDQTFEVAIGPMKMRIARDDIAEVVSSASAPNPGKPPGKSPIEAARRHGISVSVAEPGAISSEINVIGRTADEAQDEVEKFLDRAFLAGLQRIRIVHGTGMGVLRRTLRAWLQRHPQVATVAEPPHNEGGAGATIVELRE